MKTLHWIPALALLALPLLANAAVPPVAGESPAVAAPVFGDLLARWKRRA